MTPNEIGIGQIVLGLLLVMGLAVVVYLFGMLIVSRFRTGRVQEETDITYPAVPQSEDDRRAKEAIAHRDATVAPDNATDMALHEQGARTPHADTATDEELRERAMGEPMREMRQSPTRSERPVDADSDRGLAPDRSRDLPATGRTDQNPL